MSSAQLSRARKASNLGRLVEEFEREDAERTEGMLVSDYCWGSDSCARRNEATHESGGGGGGGEDGGGGAGEDGIGGEDDEGASCCSVLRLENPWQLSMILLSNQGFYLNLISLGLNQIEYWGCYLNLSFSVTSLGP